MEIVIYHNRDCTLSCAVLKMLQDKGADVQVIDYMQDPPGRSDLVRLLNLLRLSPKDIMRQREACRMGINPARIELNAALDTLARNPALIERPIILSRTGGVVCHTPETAAQFLSDSMEYA